MRSNINMPSSDIFSHSSIINCPSTCQRLSHSRPSNSNNSSSFNLNDYENQFLRMLCKLFNQKIILVLNLI